MRGLVYGGIDHASRWSVGSWKQEQLSGVLGDTYGLLTHRFVFGLGLLEQQPFLIVRKLQTVPPNRNYAYSLLLDPDREVWQRFEWNAAWLALSLFDEMNAVSRDFLLHPENYDKSDKSGFLKTLLNGLRSTPLVPLDPSHQDWLNLWVGAALAKENIVIKPASLNLKTPTLDECAALLADPSLPAAFRTGRGWLVGGSRPNGQGLGAHLILDDGDDAERQASKEEVIEKCRQDGHQVLMAWHIVESNQEYRSALDALKDIPLWEWQTQWGCTPQQLCQQLITLAKLLRPNEVDDEVIRTAKRLQPVSGPLREVLGHALDQVVKSPQSQSSREPSLETWRRQITKAQRVSQVATLLHEAPNSPEVATICQEALARTTQNSRLTQWTPYLTELPELPEKVCEIVRNWLCDEAQRRVEARSPHWQEDYLVFGQDAGGKSLARLHLHSDKVKDFIEYLINQVGREGSYKDLAHTWLSQLAASPFRSQVPLDTKLKLYGVTGEPWGFLQRTLGLYRGQQQNVSLETQSSIPAAERSYLWEELHGMIMLDQGNTRPLLTGAPNLWELGHLLEPLPDEILDGLWQLRPRLRLSRETLYGWIEGWFWLKYEEVAQEELRRFICDSDVPWSDEYPWQQLQRLGHGAMEQVLHQLLHGGSTRDAARYIGKFFDLLERVRDPEGQRLIRLITSTLNIYKQEETLAQVFLRRFGNEVDALLAKLPDTLQDQLLDLFYQYEPAKVHRILYKALETNESTPALRAAARFYLRFERLPREVGKRHQSDSADTHEAPTNAPLSPNPTERSSSPESHAASSAITESQPRRWSWLGLSRKS